LVGTTRSGLGTEDLPLLNSALNKKKDAESTGRKNGQTRGSYLSRKRDMLHRREGKKTVTSGQKPKLFEQILRKKHGGRPENDWRWVSGGGRKNEGGEPVRCGDEDFKEIRVFRRRAGPG